MRYFVLFCSLVTLTVFIVGEAFAEDSGGFYSGRKGGFYWYMDDPPPEEEEYFEMPEPDRFVYEDLWRMHPDKMAEVLETRKIIAIQSPTEENALRYIEAQDVAKRKSMAFAGAMGAASQMNPRFSNVSTTTMIAPAKRAYYQAKDAEIEGVLGSAAEDFALVVFEAASCHYCEAQRPILERFKISHGWTVRYVDIDEYRPMAERYGIDMTPSVLMLARESSAAVPISKGVVSMADLRKRLMRAIRYARGETEPAQWFNEEGVPDPLKFVEKGRVQR